MKFIKKYFHVIVFIIYSIFTTYITYPLIFHITDLATGYGDELNYSWLYNWVIHSFLSGNILNLFNTNIFYPYQIGLTDSDPNLVTSILSIIPYLIFKEPIVAVNFTQITSILFVGFSVYLLSFYLTKNKLASFISGMLVMFSPAYLAFYVHLQIFAIEFVPISLLFFIIYFHNLKQRYLILSFIFLTLQIYNNFMAGYFILFSYLIIFIYLWFSKKNIIKVITKTNILLFITACLLTLPIVLPYFKVSKEFNYVRDIREGIHLAIQPEDLLYTSIYSRLNNFLNTLPINQHSQNNEYKPGFLGFLFTILLVISFIYVLKNFKKQKFYTKSFISIALLGLILSFGPVLHLARHTIHQPFVIPLPYSILYYIIPGFQGIRNTARWEVLFILAGAVVIAIVLSELLKKTAFNKQLLIYALFSIVIISEYNFPIYLRSVPTYNNFPKVYKWLTTTNPNIKIIEMPVYNWNMFPYGGTEYWRMYYSTINFRRTVNGGGGFTPPPWQKMAYDLDATFPSNETIQKLKDMGINYIIVHTNEFDLLNKDKFKIYGNQIPDGNFVLNALAQNKSLTKIKQFDNDFVFEFK